MAKFIKLTDRANELVVVNTNYIVLAEDLTDCGRPTNTGLIYLVAGHQVTLYVQEPIAEVARLLAGDAPDR